MAIGNTAGGKGSGRRRSQVSEEVEESNWERIFGKKDLKIKDVKNSPTDFIAYPETPKIGEIFEFKPGRYKFFLKLGCKEPRWVDEYEITIWFDIKNIPEYKWVRLYSKEYDKGPGGNKNGIIVGCYRPCDNKFFDELGQVLEWNFSHWTFIGVGPVLK